MIHLKPDPLQASILVLRQALAADGISNPMRWTDAVHAALGRLADGIRDRLQNAEQMAANVGDINPDFQNAPVMDRHVETTRNQLIRLGEQVHQLRAEILHADGMQPLDAIQVRLRGEELAAAVDKVRESDDKFILQTANTNPGAGE